MYALPVIWKSLRNVQIHGHSVMRMMRCTVSMCSKTVMLARRTHCMMAEHRSPWRCGKTTTWVIHYEARLYLSVAPAAADKLHKHER